MSESARYVAIIMDGNARWASEHSVDLLAGHRAGADTLKQTVKDAVGLGIEQLTVYAFSTENWLRPTAEVNGLMVMFSELIEHETPELNEQGVRMVFIGRRERLTEELKRQMDWATAETATNTRMTLFVAFNYGGRAELVDAAASFEGGSEEDFAALLYAPDMQDPDLVIRTSGERRLSNFLIWQSAYSELYFSDVLWPDFDVTELAAAIADCDARKRRFGAR